MICQATYDSLEAIPENLREEFHQVNGQWQLKDTAIPGVGPLFNAALATNEKKAVDQVKLRNKKIRELETELNDLQDKLTALDQPGHRVLSPEDAEAFDRYTKLGTPKDLESRLTEEEKLRKQVQEFQTSENLRKIATSSTVKINPEVLSDWAQSVGDGVEFFVKTVEMDDKGKKVEVEVPHVRLKKTSDDGKVEVSEKELLPFAKEVLPDWKYTALTTVNGQTSSEQPQRQTPREPAGVKLPNFGSTKNAPEPSTDKEKKPVEKFNAQRAERPSPFTKPLPIASGIGKIPG